MNYEKNKKYFKPVSYKWGIILIIIGLLTMIGSLLYGVIFLAIGAAIIYFQINGRPTDAEIDNIYRSEIQNVIDKGLKKLGVDEDEVKLIDPMVISGPYYKNISRGYRTKKGKDNLVRSSNYEVTVLFFSEKQVFSYSYRFSLIENERNEGTDEYFYKDIVSVSTSSDSITFKDNVTGKDDTANIEYFKLTTSGGTSISCSIWDIGAIEKSVQGMKQLLRKKKTA